MAIAINANTFAVGSTGTTLVSPSFSVGAGELVIVLGGSGTAQTTIATTTNLVFTSVGTYQTESHLWYAYSSSATSGTVTLSGGLGGDGFLSVMSFTGAGTTIGAVASAAASTVNLTTTSAGSWIFCQEWATGGSTITWSAGTNQTLINQHDNTTGSNWSVGRGRQTSVTPTLGTVVTMNFTTTGAVPGSPSIVAYEIPAGAALPVSSGAYGGSPGALGRELKVGNGMSRSEIAF